MAGHPRFATAAEVEALASSGITGPDSATDGHLAVFDGSTGAKIKDGGAIPIPESPEGITGPDSAIDGHLAVFDGTSGKLIKDGGTIPIPETPEITMSFDTGWQANADAGDKMQGIAGAAQISDVTWALDNLVPGAGNLLQCVAAKVKALETALRASKLPGQ